MSSPLASAIYEGRVTHSRLEPVRHAFDYRHYLLYLDLDETEQVFGRRWLWSDRRPALGWFRREDHLGPPETSLAEAVRDLVEERVGRRPSGAIRILTHPRVFGHGFNPVSFYWCHEADGAGLAALVAEVHNTPWGERSCYVLAGDDAAGDERVRVWRASKDFHVSPFLPMDLDYVFRMGRPGEELSVGIDVLEEDRTIFTAGMRLQRRPIDGVGLARVLARYPLSSLRVVGAIYLHAARLWWKGAPFHPHPKHAREARG